MEILLVRHGIAERPEDGRDDAERPMSERGRRVFRGTLRTLERMDLMPDAVLASPWLRAEHTAHLLAEAADVLPSSTPLLAAAPQAELLALCAASDAERLALVGHQPWLGELLAWLVLGDEGLPLADRFRIKKGAVAWLRGEPQPGGMQLRALLPPRRRS